MHLGDGGVLVLEKQLNSSQSMNTHLESKLNEHSTTITINRTHIEELNRKYQHVKHNNATLTATNEKQHEELLAIKDEHMHLVHDVERYQAQLTTLTDKEAAAQQNIQVLTEVTHDLENKLSYSMLYRSVSWGQRLERRWRHRTGVFPSCIPCRYALSYRVFQHS
jgi:chromosome segregation ATPase